jgi:hypothetical protein
MFFKFFLAQFGQLNLLFWCFERQRCGSGEMLRTVDIKISIPNFSFLFNLLSNADKSERFNSIRLGESFLSLYRDIIKTASASFQIYDRRVVASPFSLPCIVLLRKGKFDGFSVWLWLMASKTLVSYN